MRLFKRKIPCIKNKCILLPICNSRDIIDCTDLKEYYIEQLDDAGGVEFIEKCHTLWTEIHEHLPCVTIINYDDGMLSP